MSDTIEIHCSERMTNKPWKRRAIKETVDFFNSNMPPRCDCKPKAATLAEAFRRGIEEEPCEHRKAWRERVFWMQEAQLRINLLNTCSHFGGMYKRAAVRLSLYRKWWLRSHFGHKGSAS